MKLLPSTTSLAYRRGSGGVEVGVASAAGNGSRGDERAAPLPPAPPPAGVVGVEAVVVAVAAVTSTTSKTPSQKKRVMVRIASWLPGATT